MHLPEFLVVGAAKSGTTTLFDYLCQSPEIFIPQRKEGRFFSQMRGDFQGPGADFQNDIIKSIDEYSDLYESAAKDQIAGDISNDYLYFYKNSIPLIKKHLGEDVKIIIFLRNPVDRAYSHYMQHLKQGAESVSFKQALDEEQQREKENWSWTFLYKKAGLYAAQIQAFKQAFKNIRIYLFEESWLKEKEPFLKDCFSFIGVQPPAVFAELRSNVSGVPKNWVVQNFFNKLGPFREAVSPILERVIGPEKTVQLRNYIQSKNLKKVPMDKAIRNELLDYYRSDIQKLGEILDRNMDIWLNSN
jgi:hypothetical protein